MVWLRPFGLLLALTDRSTGLHLTPEGYRVLYHEMMVLIAKTWPDQLPEKLPMILPAWNDLEAWSRL